MLKNLSIIRKGLLVIFLPILCQMLLLGYLYRRQVQQADSQHWALHTKDVILLCDRVVTSTLQIQTSLLGFVVTENKIFTQDEAQTMEQIELLLNQLRSLVADNPPQIQRVTVIQSLARQRVQWGKDVNALLRENRREEALAKIRTLEGKHLIDRLLAEVDNFRDVEEGLDRERITSLDNGARLQNQVLVAGVILTIALGLIASQFLSRGLTSRIAVLRENSRRFMRGETLAPAVPGRDEIGELDRNFHEMAETIAASRLNEHEFQATLEKQNLDLVNANRDLDHKNRENEMFVYSVSHDLRSPLVNLQGFSKELGTARDSLKEMLLGEMDLPMRQRAGKIIDRDVSESIRFIQAAVMRLSAIIDALLRLSRVGRVEYKGEQVLLSAVVTRILEAMRSQIDLKGVEMKIHDLPTLWGDPTALEQIFANLIGNAVNYLDPTRPGIIEVAALPEPAGDLEGMQVIFVKDNGLGISEAYLPKVFTIFQRLHGNIAPGEGIGLALVRRMVERHGGKIWVESVDKVGSTFFVALPAREKSTLVIAPKKESIRLAGSTLASAKP